MKNLRGASIQYENNQLSILDQTLLPQHEQWVLCHTIDDMIHSIQRLAVRGASLIGVAASLSLAHFAEKNTDRDALRRAATALHRARPTAVKLQYCMNLMLAIIDDMTNSAAQIQSKIITLATNLFDEDVALDAGIAQYGVPLIVDGDNILTHCHTGALTGAGPGSALGIICAAHANKKIHVYVDETRPLLQGGRLTAWELGQNNIPYTLICDNMAASLMAQGKISKVLVGADRIAVNGDFANKIGTYNVAVIAKYHQIPFYVAAGWTSIDPECASGKHIPIEERNHAEVFGASGYFGQVRWAPDDAVAYNPAFDVTPADLITGWILDTGLFNQQDVLQGALRNAWLTQNEQRRVIRHSEVNGEKLCKHTQTLSKI